MIRKKRMKAPCLFLPAMWVVLIAGCNPGTPLERSGVEVTVPVNWRTVRPATWMVPGTALAAWSGPSGSSLVIYRTLWVPGGSPEMLLEAQENRLANLPGTKLLVKRLEKIGGAGAARLELVAPGMGDSLAASGLGEPIQPSGKTLVPTRQVTVAFALPTETIFLTWHSPEGSFEQIEPDIRATLQSLRLSAKGAAPYRE